MAFPSDPLPVAVELLLDGVWTDITSLVYDREQPQITRGRQDEQGQVSPSSFTAELNDRDGVLSPRNPVGQYYGLIGRNTRMRVRLTSGAPDPYVLMQSAGSNVSTPDTANLGITGDIDIRIELDANLAAVGGNGWGLVSKYEATGDQRSWAFYIGNTGKPTITWSPDGTDASRITKAATTALSTLTGRQAIRATIDVNNGASGNTVTFYTSDRVDGTWAQLGSTVVTAGTTSIFDSTASLIVGGVADVAGITQAPRGRLYDLHLFSGIAGTQVVGMAPPGNGEPGDTSFVETLSGRTWTLSSIPSIVDPAIRFQGEVSEWPVRWDPGGNDISAPIQAAGILRRLAQGATQLKSTLYRGLVTLTNPPKAYWPCEDADGSTTFASAIGGPPMTILGSPSLASFTDFACSAALPTIQNSQWIGRVPAYAGTGKVQVWWLMQIPAGAATVNEAIMHVFCTGTAPTWRLEYAAAGGDLRLRAFDADGTSLLDSGVQDFNVDGQLIRIGIQLEQVGANVDWSIDTLEVGLGKSAGGTGGTLNSRTIDRCTGVRTNNAGGLGDDIVIGHIAVHDELLDLFTLAGELNAHEGENALDRVSRLCGEEGVLFRAAGDRGGATAMGPQLPNDLLTLLQEAADADNGILYEPRDLFGLAYRTRESMYNQAARLELDYDAGQVAALEPTDDDQQTRNDITLTRQGGSSFRAVQQTGPLSILAPPDGVGRYDTSTTLNLQSDGQLPDAAGWLLHLGTVDEARYPLVGLNLAHNAYTSDAALTLAAEDLDVGDRLVITNPPAWLPPDQISLLAQGFVETLGAVTHTIQANCSPESPWGQAGVFDDGVSRYAGEGWTINEDLTTTETDVTVVSTTGPPWTHADGDFDIRIGGEVMTVTAISGATSPQTLTVTRSVNGVVKEHLADAAVQLDQPRVYVP